MKDADFLAVDTEFERASTYWPRLSLIQVACGHKEGIGDVFVIDAADRHLDLSPFREIIVGRKPTKVFHAARQDLEIFYHIFGQLPPQGAIFDTQIASMACFCLDFPSYARLCQTVLGVNIDKSLQRTDWLKRPLSPPAIGYAVRDVTHLSSIYRYLKGKLAALDRLEWIADSHAALVSPQTYVFDAASILRRLRVRLRVRLRRRESVTLLHSLLVWREEKARMLDVPRDRVLKSSDMVDLASRLSAESVDVAEIEKNLLANKQTADHAGDILRFVLVSLEAKGRAPSEPADEPTDEGGCCSGLLERRRSLLRTLVDYVCQSHGVSRRLLTPDRRDLEDLACYDRGRLVENKSTESGNKLLRGWRWRVFGCLACKLLREKVFFGASA